MTTITQSPTTTDKSIIAEIINHSEYSHTCTPNDVVTIWLDGAVVWIKLSFGYLPFHCQQFKTAVAAVKALLPVAA